MLDPTFYRNPAAAIAAPPEPHTCGVFLGGRGVTVMVTIGRARLSAVHAKLTRAWRTP